jgi:thiamine-monophosphate kinase
VPTPPRGRSDPTLREAGEFGLLARLLPTLPAGGRGVRLGPGDDCAVVAARGALLLTVDALVEGVHFRRDWLSPAALGRKAFAVNASDVAAMGGRPRWCVLQIGAPPRTPAADVAAVSRAVAAAARGAGAALVGGNLSRAVELSVTLALVGAAPPRPVTRAGARPGDALYVTGTLGDAALGARLLRRNRDAGGPAVRRFRAPTPRLAAGELLARRGLASAMIDVSDGLLQDLGHLCAASRVGARVALARVPCSAAVRRAGADLALRGGEDYELLFAVPRRREAALVRAAGQFGCRITRIGEITRGREVRLVDAQGREVPVGDAGFDHFRG